MGPDKRGDPFLSGVKVVMTMPVTAQHLQSWGYLHGGASVALLMLIPQQAFLAYCLGVLCGGLLIWILMTYLHLDTLRKVPTTYRRDIVRIFVLYHLAALSFVGAPVSFLIWGAPGFYGIVAATFLS